MSVQSGIERKLVDGLKVCSARAVFSFMFTCEGADVIIALNFYWNVFSVPLIQNR